MSYVRVAWAMTAALVLLTGAGCTPAPTPTVSPSPRAAGSLHTRLVTYTATADVPFIVTYGSDNDNGVHQETNGVGTWTKKVVTQVSRQGVTVRLSLRAQDTPSATHAHLSCQILIDDQPSATGNNAPTADPGAAQCEATAAEH